MAHPRYIIASQGLVTDKDSGLVSHMNVIDALSITAVRLKEESEAAQRTVHVESIPIHVCAVWTREEEDDPEQEFEHQIRLYLPGKDEPTIAPQGTFKFAQPFHRFLANIQGTGFTESGEFVIESQIRKVGDETWISQRFPITVTVNVIGHEEFARRQQQAS